MTKTILLLQIASTLVLVGVIWTVQIVQYPFFSQIAAAEFSSFHRTYTNWITPIVAPPMLVELATSVALLFFPPENIDSKLIWAGLILALLAWASTFALQVPLHEKLARGGFDPKTHRALVNTNWIRTAVWSLRGVLVLYFAWQLIRL
jgi:hypothetical protein